MDDYSSKEIARIKRDCKREAHAITQAQYQRYDDIWTNRIRITPRLLEHGQDTIRQINALMPNFLTRNPQFPAVDEVAEDFGFSSSSDLVSFLLAYRPRGSVRQFFYENLVAERLGGIADIPF